MLETIILSIASFVGTNMDDMIINTFFFSSAEKRRDICAVVLGKYLGIGALILISIAVSRGLDFLPVRCTGLLGLIPVALGVKSICCREQEETNDAGDMRGGRSAGWLRNTALVTVANGADNIGVYVPLFAGFSYGQYAVFCGVFALMTALWCALSYRISRLSFLKNVLDRYRGVVTPAVYILLGVYIMLRNIV